MNNSTPTTTRGGTAQTQRRRKARAKGLRAPLGVFQYALACAIKRLPPDLRYGAQIARDLTERIGVDIDEAQIYVTAAKMVVDGFLKSEIIAAPDGTSRTVKAYRLTEKGTKAATETGKLLARLA